MLSLRNRHRQPVLCRGATVHNQFGRDSDFGPSATAVRRSSFSADRAGTTRSVRSHHRGVTDTTSSLRVLSHSRDCCNRRSRFSHSVVSSCCSPVPGSAPTRERQDTASILLHTTDLTEYRPVTP